jgi:hypothetical protein
VLFYRNKPVHVYCTLLPRRAVNPRGVWDKVITGERWLIPPVEMKLVEIIPEDLADRVHCAIRLYHQCTKQKSSLRLRLAQYAVAIKVLGPERSSRLEERIVRQFCEDLGIGDDPESYILNAAEKEQCQTIP